MMKTMFSCSSATLFTKLVKMDFFAVYQVDILDSQDVVLCFMNSELTGVKRGKCDLQVNRTSPSEHETFLSYNRYESTCSRILRQRSLCCSVQRNTSNKSFLDQTAAAEKVSGLSNRPDDCCVEMFQRWSSSVLKHQQQRLQVTFRMWTQCPAESGQSQLCSGSNISRIWSTCCIRFDSRNQTCWIYLPSDQPTNQNLLWILKCWTRMQQNPLNL